MQEETLDEIINGHLHVFQKKRGYRFSLDSLLIAHYFFLKQSKNVLDLGCGSGIILLILAKRFPHINFTGLDIQEELVELARKNVNFNKLEQRIKVVEGDARKIKNVFPANSFDAVIFNPPYRKLNSGRINPQMEKAIARHEIKGSLKDFIKAAKYLLKQEGKVFTIYPAKRLVELIMLFHKNSIEPKRMKPVYSDNMSAAEFVLFEGRKGSGEEIKFEQPLIIYDRNKKYTADMADIFNELARFPGAAAD
jgi:tRNA1Val (adenine37-N6)-methyltransferase